MFFFNFGLLSELELSKGMLGVKVLLGYDYLQEGDNGNRIGSLNSEIDIFVNPVFKLGDKLSLKLENEFYLKYQPIIHSNYDEKLLKEKPIMYGYKFGVVTNYDRYTLGIKTNIGYSHISNSVVRKNETLRDKETNNLLLDLNINGNIRLNKEFNNFNYGGNVGISFKW